MASVRLGRDFIRVPLQRGIEAICKLISLIPRIGISALCMSSAGDTEQSCLGRWYADIRDVRSRYDPYDPIISQDASPGGALMAALET